MNFFKHQGYEIRNNIIYQDNETAIKLESNGRNSYTGNSRHVDRENFWVKDRVDKNEVQIKYCPTTLLLGDYVTRPLEGNVFRSVRDVIMQYKHINDLLLDLDFLLMVHVKKLYNILIRKSKSNPNESCNTYTEAIKNNVSQHDGK